MEISDALAAVRRNHQAVLVTIKRDGKPHVDVEVSDVQLSEKLDDGVFVKP